MRYRDSLKALLTCFQRPFREAGRGRPRLTIQRNRLWPNSVGRTPVVRGAMTEHPPLADNTRPEAAQEGPLSLPCRRWALMVGSRLIAVIQQQKNSSFWDRCYTSGSFLEGVLADH